MIADRISDRKSPSLLHSNLVPRPISTDARVVQMYTLHLRQTDCTDTWRTPRRRASSIVPGSPALARSRAHDGGVLAPCEQDLVSRTGGKTSVARDERLPRGLHARRHSSRRYAVAWTRGPATWHRHMPCATTRCENVCRTTRAPQACSISSVTNQPS